MKKTDLVFVEGLLKGLSQNRFQMAMSYLTWLRDYEDEDLSALEKKNIKIAKKEKGGISWAVLRSKMK